MNYLKSRIIYTKQITYDLLNLNIDLASFHILVILYGLKHKYRMSTYCHMDIQYLCFKPSNINNNIIINLSSLFYTQVIVFLL